MNESKVQNHWVCVFDLDNTQKCYAALLKMVLWIEDNLHNSVNNPLYFKDEFMPFRILRGEKLNLSNADTLLILEKRFSEKNFTKYRDITSATKLVEGLKRAGGFHTFHYYLRINLNDKETDIVELQYLVLMLQALPDAQNRISVRIMEKENATWTPRDFFRVSDYLRFVQNHYHCFYSCYDDKINSLRPLSNISGGVQSTFLPVLEVDNRLCKILNISWKLEDNYEGQSFDRLYTALTPQGCKRETLTWTLFQIGLRMLFESLSGRSFNTIAKKKELLSFLIDTVREMQGVTPLDMLLFGALAGDRLKNKNKWNTVKAYMGNIQTFSLAISQILENAANHSQHNRGVFTFRLQRNLTYLRTHYPDYSPVQDVPSLEVMIADSNNSDGIVDHFLKSSKADALIKNQESRICLSNLFGFFQDTTIENIWRIARLKRPEMCHGLLSFFANVQYFKGAVRVRSVPKFMSSTDRDMFYYDGRKHHIISGVLDNGMYIPGTQFSIVVNRPSSISAALRSNEDWEFDFDTLVYATTYKELAQALRFNDNVHDLAVSEAVTPVKGPVQSQKVKDEAALKWKEWFNNQCQKGKNTKYEVFQCDLKEFCEILAQKPELGEPFCKGFLSSQFFFQDKKENEKIFYAVLFQNFTAQFSRIFAGTLQAMAYLQELDLSHISVYFYPKQYKNDNFPYCATTLHRLLGLKVNEKEFPRIFPYSLFLKGKSGHTLFEDELFKQADSPIYMDDQGFKIPMTHMRLGNKVHLDTFYEMALFFENPNYAYYTAYLLLKILLERYPDVTNSSKKFLFYGYASYSRAVVWALHQILEEYCTLKKSSEKGKNKETEMHAPETEFIIYQNDLKLETDQPQVQMYYSRSEWQYDPSKIWDPEDTELIMIVPISSSLTTFNKMKAELCRETRKAFSPKVNFTAFWVRDNYKDERSPTDVERTFWKSCNPSNKTIESPLVSGEIHYLRSAKSRWSDPMKCKCCFPENALMEYPLVETDPTSTIPTQQFYKESDAAVAKECIENDARVAELRGNVLYGHISKGSNHYQYYIKPRSYFLQQRDKIKNWLIALREQTLAVEPNLSAPNRINVMIIPQQIDNVEFSQYVYEYYFQAHAECVVINTEKEFRSNLQAEYSGLFWRLRNAVKTQGQTVNFYFIDNSVCSGNSFTRAMSLVSSCMKTQKGLNSFDFQLKKVFLLISRLSEASKRMYVKDPSQDFHAYVELHISAMRTFGDSCIPCKVQREAQQYYKKAATKSISSYWEKKSYARRCISFDQFELPFKVATEQCEREHQQEDGYRRMICSHRAAYYIRPVQGKEKSDYFFAVRSYLEELRTVGSATCKYNPSIYCDINDENRREWISAGLKVLARPFFTFDYRLRCVVMDLLLLLSEFLIKRTPLEVVKKRLENTDKNYIKNYIIENENLGWCKSFSDDILRMSGDNLFQQLVFIRDHMLKGLADIKSNYILRLDTMIQVSYRLSEAIISCHLNANAVSEFYDHYLRSILRITHSSSDETKGVWLEHLLQYGQEYPGNTDKQLDGIDQIVEMVPQNVQKQFREFLEILLVENNRPIYQAVAEFSKDHSFKYTQEVPDTDKSAKTFFEEYHMRNAKIFLSYGYNEDTYKQLCVLVNLLQLEKNVETYKHRYQSLGEALKSIVCLEAGEDKNVFLFGKNAESQSTASQYLDLADYYTLFPIHLYKKINRDQELEYPMFEERWKQIKNSARVQMELKKNGFSLMKSKEGESKYDIIIELDNNYDELTTNQSKIDAAVSAQEPKISIQKIDPIYIYIPCALRRQKTLGLARKILMFRCMLIEWLEKDFNNNAIAVLSQQQHIAKLLSTDKMGDHAENDFVECQQQLLLATNENEFDEERETGNWKYAVDAIGRRQELYELPEGAKPPLQGYLAKAQEWFFLRSYINSRISRLFRTMVRTVNEMEDGNVIDVDNYYSRDGQSALMRPVFDLVAVFYTPVKPGYIRKNYLRQMLEVVTFKVEGVNDYGRDNNAEISVRMRRLSQLLDGFVCVNIRSEKTGEAYSYLSEYLAAILLDCFISGVKAGQVWNQEGWGGDAYCQLAQKEAAKKCEIELYREDGDSFEGYDFDYLVIRNKIHHTLRSEKKGPGMSQAAIRWYIEGLWKNCIESRKRHPEVLTQQKNGSYIIKLPILKQKGDKVETL